MSLRVRLRRTQPPPDCAGVAKAHAISRYDYSARWVPFVLGGLLLLLGWGLLLRMLFLPR